MAVTYFGNNDNGNANTNFTQDYCFAIRAQCGTTGNLSELGININNTYSGESLIRIGVYADSAGPAPGTLLLDGGEITVPLSGAGWYSKTGLTLAVTSGTYYWIAFNNYDTRCWIYYNTAKNAVYHGETYGALADPYGSPTAFDGYGMSMRAGVEASAAESNVLYMTFES